MDPVSRNWQLLHTGARRGMETPPTDIVKAIKKGISMAWDVHHKILDSFWAHPVSLMRSNMNVFHAWRYVIAEKTDGVRYLLCFFHVVIRDVPYRLCVFVTRSGTVYASPMLASVKTHNGTVLDGELVVTRSGRKRFLVFDCIQVDGVNKSNCESYMERLRAADGALKTLQTLDEDLEVTMKPVYDMKQIRMVVNEVIPSLEHKNDGLIFTPLYKALVLDRNAMQFKWKNGQQHTIDFVTRNVRKAAGQTLLVDLYMLQRQNLVLYKAAQKVRMVDVCLMAPQVTAVWELEEKIVEYAHVIKLGLWVPQRIRYDKSVPNEQFTVMKTIENIMENISIEQVITCVMVTQ